MIEDRAFTVENIDHVGFAVSFLDRAITFWVEGLGAVLLRRAEMGGVFLGEVTGARGATVRTAIVEIADRRIELLEYVEAPPRRGPTAAPFDAGAAHLALRVSDLNAVLSRIAEYGWRAQGEPQAIASGPLAGTRVMYAIGPDGEAIEFMQSAK